jgi:uncharacterized surface protein with fasciclin (FAS1) repeats
MFRFVATVAAIGAIASSVSAATIVDQAVATERLSTLVTAVKAAGLVEALSGDGPVTVFAPDNDAFGRLDDETIAYLLTDAGRSQLTRILLHHVVPGRLDAATLIGQSELTTLAGTTLSLEVAKDRLLVNDAVVETADIGASNGVVHIIDRVLLPPVQMTPLETLLVNAIDRGVPLFNEGSPEGCAAVYATALDAVVAVPGFGVSEKNRMALSPMLDRIALDTDASERAWSYRGLMDALLSGDMEASTSAADDTVSERVVFDFNDPSSVRAFGVVLDGVMGGLSTGRVSSGVGSMVFDGETSLRNNGGFSSIRAMVPEGSFDGADSIRMRCKGDGRTWIIGTRASRNLGGDSYWTRFDTVDGEWMTIVVPIDKMERTSFGQALRGRISPSQVRGLEFYMYDKKSGPFRLEVDSIEAVSAPDEA